MTCDAERHGATRYAWRCGCRCPEAIEGYRAYYRARRALIGAPDHAVVALAILGFRPSMTNAERQAAIDALDGPGASAQTVAECLGCSARTVVRQRARRRARGRN